MFSSMFFGSAFVKLLQTCWFFKEVCVSVFRSCSYIHLGQYLIVVGDEAVPEATDTFADEQGAGGETVNGLDNDIL